MNDFLLYLLKANLIALILYVFYVLFLKRDTFYGYHRWYLLATVLSALLLPIASLSGWFVAPPVAAMQQMPSVENFYRIWLLMQADDSPSAAVAAAPAIHIESWVAIVLLTGTGWLLIHRLRQLAHVLHLSFRTPTQMYGQQPIKTMDAPIQPFSFFRWIFLPISRLRDDTLEEIVSHEQIHCRNLHSVDILLAELLACCCWYNPVVWLLRGEIRSNIEFYTDRQMLAHGFERKHYQYQLLNISSGNSRYSIVNHFYFNHLKKRIIMMNKKDSPKILVAKYLLAIPVMFATMLAVRASGIETAITKNAETTVSIPFVTAVQPTEQDNAVAGYENTPEDPTQFLTQLKATKMNVGINEINDIILYGSAVGTILPNGMMNYQANDSIVIQNRAIGNSLIIVDGKIVSPEDFFQLRYDYIESLTVWKGDQAIEQYGEPAKNGVIIITTKQNKETAAQQDHLKVNTIIFAREFSSGKSPLFIVDGKIVSKEETKQLKPENIDNIENITILKDGRGIEQYGEQAKDGVVIITLKKDGNIALPFNESVSPDYRIRQGTAEK